jgi:hypothetical protein
MTMTGRGLVATFPESVYLARRKLDLIAWG